MTNVALVAIACGLIIGLGAMGACIGIGMMGGGSVGGGSVVIVGPGRGGWVTPGVGTVVGTSCRGPEISPSQAAKTSSSRAAGERMSPGLSKALASDLRRDLRHLRSSLLPGVSRVPTRGSTGSGRDGQ